MLSPRIPHVTLNLTRPQHRGNPLTETMKFSFLRMRGTTKCCLWEYVQHRARPVSLPLRDGRVVQTGAANREEPCIPDCALHVPEGVEAIFSEKSRDRVSSLNVPFRKRLCELAG